MYLVHTYTEFTWILLVEVLDSPTYDMNRFVHGTTVFS